MLPKGSTVDDVLLEAYMDDCCKPLSSTKLPDWTLACDVHRSAVRGKNSDANYFEKRVIMIIPHNLTDTREIDEIQVKYSTTGIMRF